MGRRPPSPPPCSGAAAGLKKGPWTAEEDEKLTACITAHGHRSWRALPELAGLSRCGKSCRLRWTNYLRPDIKRGMFTDGEERQIIELHAALGNKWSAIAGRIPGRTDNEIKNHWNTHIRKKLLQMGVDPVTHQPRPPPDLGRLLSCTFPVDLLAADNYMAAAAAAWGPLNVDDANFQLQQAESAAARLAKLHLLHNLLLLLQVLSAGHRPPPTTMSSGTLLGAAGGGVPSFLSSLGLLQSPPSSFSNLGITTPYNSLINKTANLGSYDSRDNSPTYYSTPSLVPASPENNGAAASTLAALDQVTEPLSQQVTSSVVAAAENSSTVVSTSSDPIWEGLEFEDFTTDHWKDVLDQLMS